MSDQPTKPVALDIRQQQRAEALRVALSSAHPQTEVEVVLRMARWVLDGDNRLPAEPGS